MASEMKKRRLAALEQREHGPTTSAPKQQSSGQKASAPSASLRPKLQSQSPGVNKSPSGKFLSLEATAPQDPVYASLDAAAQTGPSAIFSGLHEPMDDPGEFVDELLRKLLASSGHVVDPTAALESKIQDKTVLLDNPGGPAAVARADRVRRRQQREASKRAPHHMSARQHRLQGTHKIPLELQRYSLYLPLHELWKEYITGLLADTSPASVPSRLISADFHGAIIAVARAKDPTLVGSNGIVVKETTKTFSVITPKDRLSVLPKRGVVFQIRLEETSLTLFGDALVTVRASRQVGASKGSRRETTEL